MGNNAVQLLKNQAGGIRGLSGKVEWVEKYGVWVVWCVHPSFVMRNVEENEPFFTTAVEAFAKIFKRMKVADAR
jgi:uracil-DNA glycosylase